jgi:hypothetical protein
MDNGLADLDELFDGRSAQTANTVLKGHVAVFGAQGTGKTAFAASIATMDQYANAGFIQKVKHTIWFSPHVAGPSHTKGKARTAYFLPRPD